MCGIVGVVRRRAERAAPASERLQQALDRALVALAPPGVLAARLAAAAAEVEAVDRELRGAPGLATLLGDPQGALVIAHRADQLWLQLDKLEVDLDHDPRALLGPSDGDAFSAAELETVNAALVRARDAVWAVSRDRLRTARAVSGLAGPEPSPAALDGYLSIQIALSAIDRLEVRGRDSAGLHLLVRGHGLDLVGTRGPPAARPAHGRLALRLRVGADRRRAPGLRLQGGGRDRRARRQYGRPPGSGRGRRSPASRALGRHGRSDGPRPHALGQRRHHLRSQRPSAQRRGDQPGPSIPTSSAR